MSATKSATGSIPKITPGQIPGILETCYKGRIPAMFWGPPGVGKSDSIRSFCKENRLGLVDVRLSQYDPVDLRGVPKVVSLSQTIGNLRDLVSTFENEGNKEQCGEIHEMIQSHVGALAKGGDRYFTHWASPSFLPVESVHGKRGILFLDELTSADAQVQAAAYQLVLDRRLGDYELPDGWLVVGAGNRPEDRAVSRDMSSALANRFSHYECEHSFEDWMNWAIDAQVDPRVVSYLKYKEGASLFKFDPSSNDKAFPTPRSWERVSDALKASLDKSDHGIKQAGRTAEFPTLNIQGAIGIGEGVEFEAFSDLKDHIPDIDEFMAEAAKGKKYVKLPSISDTHTKKKTFKIRNAAGDIVEETVQHRFDGSAVLYLLLTSASARVNEENVDAIWNIADRLMDEDQPSDFSIWFVRDAMRRNAKIMAGKKGSNTHKRMLEWASQNRDLLRSMKD